MAQSPYYAGREWPEYKFVEYPKMVNGVVVDNADREAEVLADAAITAPAPVVDVSALMAQIAALKAQVAAQPMLDADGVDVRAELIGQAEAHGISIDRRWGVDRLKSALNGV